MAVASGMRIGSYEVVAKLGDGGIGEVYRARDTKLDPHVALKVLSDLFASDAEVEGLSPPDEVVTDWTRLIKQ